MKGLAHPPWQLDELTPAAVSRVLPELAGSFFANGARAARPETNDAKLHAFRLNAKEFRYTLEAFRPLYGPAMDRHISQVRRIQTVLGDLNDCRATGDLLTPYEALAAAEVELLRRFLDERRVELRAKFTETWTALYGEERRRLVLIRYLRTRVAGRSSAEL